MAKLTLAPDGRLYSVSEHGAIVAGVPAAAASDYRFDNARGGSSDVESSASMFEMP